MNNELKNIIKTNANIIHTDYDNHGSLICLYIKAPNYKSRALFLNLRENEITFFEERKGELFPKYFELNVKNLKQLIKNIGANHDKCATVAI